MEEASGATGFPCRPSSPSIQFFFNCVKQSLSFPFEIVAVVYGIERPARTIIRTPDIYSGSEMLPPLLFSLIGVW